MHKLGLVSVSFRKHTPEEILQAMQNTPLRYIEWGSDVHCPPEKAEELAKLQKQYGIACCSYGTYFRLGVTPICELEQYIKAAKALGADELRLWCGNKNSEDYTESEKKALFAACNFLNDSIYHISTDLFIFLMHGGRQSDVNVVLTLLFWVAFFRSVQS